MIRTLVVGAAPARDRDGIYASLLASARHVVAADAAGEWCVGLGRVPDVVVGDFDSADPGARSRLREAGVDLIEHPSDKDETDLELATAVALDRYGGPVCLTAAFTGRIDHTLAALGTLLRAGERPEIREPGWRAALCRPGSPVEETLEPGRIFSVLALTEAQGVSVSGGRWPLCDVSLGVLAGRGVSNEALGDAVTLQVEQGEVLFIIVESAG